MKLTPKDIAKEFGISDKRVRRVMRSITDDRAGHGGTWDLASDSDFVAELRSRLTVGNRAHKVQPTLNRAAAQRLAIVESVEIDADSPDFVGR